MNKIMNGYEFLQFIGLSASSANRYDEFESYVEIDPITGKLFRGAKRFQYSYRAEKNSLTPDMLSCTPPTDSYSILGYGCVIYHVRQKNQNSLDFKPAAAPHLFLCGFPSFVCPRPMVSLARFLYR